MWLAEFIHPCSHAHKKFYTPPRHNLYVPFFWKLLATPVFWSLSPNPHLLQSCLKSLHLPLLPDVMCILHDYITWFCISINFGSAYITSAAVHVIMFHLFSGKPTSETRPLVYKLMHCEKENGVGGKVLEPIKNASWNERERERERKTRRETRYTNVMGFPPLAFRRVY